VLPYAAAYSVEGEVDGRIAAIRVMPTAASSTYCVKAKAFTLTHAMCAEVDESIDRLA
jgi:hypothetical protein